MQSENKRQDCSKKQIDSPLLVEQSEKALFKVVLLHQLLDFWRVFGSWLLGFATAQHQIFGRMRKVNKFQNVHAVATVFQKHCTDAVRQKRRNTFLDDAVVEQTVKFATLLYGQIDFVLATRHGKDVLDSLGNCVVQCVVGGNVASVQRHNHVDVGAFKFVLGDVGNNKFQACVAVLLRNLVAMFHHVGFEVVANDVGLDAFYHSKVVVDEKREIRLSTTKIQNCDTLLVVGFESIVNNFDEPVDLLELVVLGLNNFEILGKHAQIHKCRDVLPFLQNVVLLAICRQILLGKPVVLLQTLAFAVGVQVGDTPIFPNKTHLLVVWLNVLLIPLQKFVLGNVLVESLIVFELLHLPKNAVFQLYFSCRNAQKTHLLGNGF